jgi:hypothetical protein
VNRIILTNKKKDKREEQSDETASKVVGKSYFS